MKTKFREFKAAEKQKSKTMQLLNIVLLHNQAPASYVDLFEKMVYFDHVIPLRGDNYIELLRFEKLATLNMYEGTIVTYMGIRDNAWFNQRSKKIESRESEEDLYANTKTTTFFFMLIRNNTYMKIRLCRQMFVSYTLNGHFLCILIIDYLKFQR